MSITDRAVITLLLLGVLTMAAGPLVDACRTRWSVALVVAGYTAGALGAVLLGMQS